MPKTYWVKKYWFQKRSQNWFFIVRHITLCVGFGHHKYASQISFFVLHTQYPICFSSNLKIDPLYYPQALVLYLSAWRWKSISWPFCKKRLCVSRVFSNMFIFQRISLTVKKFYIFGGYVFRCVKNNFIVADISRHLVGCPGILHINPGKFLSIFFWNTSSQIQKCRLLSF